MSADALLVHDFDGCGTDAVLAAVGLTMSALFNKALTHYVRPTHSRIPVMDLLDLISAETTVVVVTASDMLARRSISDNDWQRLSTATARIGRARDHAYGR